MTVPDPALANAMAGVRAIEVLSKKLSAGATDPAAISWNMVRASLLRLSKAELLDIAIVAVGDGARAKVRVRILEVEREAAHRRTVEQAQQARQAQRAALFKGRYRHGSVAKKDGAVPRGCSCSRCTRVRTSEAALDAKYAALRKQILDDYEATLKMEWTKELLALSFAVDHSGATVTWGAATVEQHQSRIDMLMGNATANIEAAARHQAAIGEITKTPGAGCLGDVFGSAPVLVTMSTTN
jgi:hypothetical protein